MKTLRGLIMILLMRRYTRPSGPELVESVAAGIRSLQIAALRDEVATEFPRDAQATHDAQDASDAQDARPAPELWRPTAHLVRPMETYGSIAVQYGTTWDKLYAYNCDPLIVGALTAQKRRTDGPQLTWCGEHLFIPPAGYRGPAAWNDQRYLTHRTAWEATGDPEELELMLACLTLADESAWPR